MLHQKVPLHNLNDIDNDFVVTPVDKANGNVAFIRVRFYVLYLKKNLVQIKIQLTRITITFK